jgi:hypothetical protein
LSLVEVAEAKEPAVAAVEEDLDYPLEQPLVVTAYHLL